MQFIGLQTWKRKHVRDARFFEQQPFKAKIGSKKLVFCPTEKAQYERVVRRLSDLSTQRPSHLGSTSINSALHPTKHNTLMQQLRRIDLQTKHDLRPRLQSTSVVLEEGTAAQPKPQTPNPKPLTQNSQPPETLNPQRSTGNSQHATFNVAKARAPRQKRAPEQ